MPANSGMSFQLLEICTFRLRVSVILGLKTKEERKQRHGGVVEGSRPRVVSARKCADDLILPGKSEPQLNVEFLYNLKDYERFFRCQTPTTETRL